MNKKTCCLVFVLCLLLIVPLFSQVEENTLLLSYRRNFIRASLTTKLDILNEATKLANPAVNDIFCDALDFVTTSKPVLGADTQLYSLALIAAEHVKKSDNAKAVELLWTLFEQYDDSKLKQTIIESLGVLAKQDAHTIVRLNSFVENQVKHLTLSQAIEAPVLIQAIIALGKIGNESSFSVLFSVLLTNANEQIISAAENSLNSLNCDYQQKITAIVLNGTIKEKTVAFRVSQKNTQISQIIHGEIAEKTLFIAINTMEEPNTIFNLRLLRYEALQEINRLSWKNAAPLVVNYFYLAQMEYKNRLMSLNTFVEIIDSLGKLGSSEASQVLSIYLGLLNSETEQNGTYNEQILLSVINALGELGDKSAFDYLLYVSYIKQYPNSIINASQDALGRLKW